MDTIEALIYLGFNFTFCQTIWLVKIICHFAKAGMPAAGVHSYTLAGGI
jgi:hypothetical protein